MIIEKGVPVSRIKKPQALGGAPRGAKPKYPFGQMAVGDSVYFPDQPKGSASNPSIASHAFARSHGWVFSSRKEGTGVRIWRIA